MINFFLFFGIILGLGAIIVTFALKYILPEKHFKKYCKFILYICFIISLILTIGGYIFEINDFKPCLVPTISNGGLIIILLSAESNKKK
ncbi:hypothetical protein [Faecalimicrobium sp. JNUCC 81]